jgi:hypothetical protein
MRGLRTLPPSHMFSLMAAYARRPVAPPEPVSEFDLLRASDAAVKIEGAIRSGMRPFWRAQAHALGLAAVGPLAAIFLFGASGEVVLMIMAVDMLALPLGDRLRLALAPEQTADAVAFVRDAAHVDATLRAMSTGVGWVYDFVDVSDDDLTLARGRIFRNTLILVGAMGAILVLILSFGAMPALAEAPWIALPLAVRLIDAAWEARAARRRPGIHPALLPQSDIYAACLSLNALAVWPLVIVAAILFGPGAGSELHRYTGHLFLGGFALSAVIVLGWWSRALRRKLPALGAFAATDRAVLVDRLQRYGQVPPQGDHSMQ